MLYSSSTWISKHCGKHPIKVVVSWAAFQFGISHFASAPRPRENGRRAGCRRDTAGQGKALLCCSTTVERKDLGIRDRAEQFPERAGWTRDSLGPPGCSSRWTMRRAEVGGEWPWAGIGKMAGWVGSWVGQCVVACSSCRQDQMRWESRTRQLAPQTGQCSVDPVLQPRLNDRC